MSARAVHAGFGQLKMWDVIAFAARTHPSTLTMQGLGRQRRISKEMVELSFHEDKSIEENPIKFSVKVTERLLTSLLKGNHGFIVE